MSFGDYIHNLRVEDKKTLRRFCLEKGLNPSYWSKIERGVNPQPKDDAVLAQWAKYFGLEPQTDEWNRFMDEARHAHDEFPKGVMSDEKVVSLLPAFLGAAWENGIGEAELKTMIQKIINANTPDECVIGG